MIFFDEEPTPKPSDSEAGPPEAEESVATPDAPPEAAVASAPAPQPALFAADGNGESEPREAVASSPAAETDTKTPAEPAAPTARKRPTRAEKAARPASAPAAKTPGPRSGASDNITDKRAVIKVVGVGGGGGNAVNRMIEAGVTGVEFIAANTDAQVLELSRAPVKIQLGSERTGGLGCGGDPEVGRLAARDDINRLIEVLAGADMVFITVGEGGGTGTGAAPVIACVAQEIKALGIAVATKPMTVEGKHRCATANDGIRELREFVDTLICVPNDRVVEVYGNLKIREAFRSADDVVRQAVQGISDLIQVPGEINLDFADVRSAMRLRGDAVMGIGMAAGDNRVEEATRSAISSPLLEDTSIEGATSIIVNVTGGESLTLNEVQQAVRVVRDAVAPEGTGIYESADGSGDNILIGTALDPAMDETGEIKVTVVATGFPDRSRANATPRDFANYTNRATGTFGARAATPGPGRSGSGTPDGASSGRVGRTTPKLEPFPTATNPEANRVEAMGNDAGGVPPSGGARPSGDAASRLVIDEPMSLPEDVGDDRWGDLETPAYLHRRS